MSTWSPLTLPTIFGRSGLLPGEAERLSHLLGLISGSALAFGSIKPLPFMAGSGFIGEGALFLFVLIIVFLELGFFFEK